MPNKILPALHQHWFFGVFVREKIENVLDHSKSYVFLVTYHKKLQVLVDEFLK
jgi:hypothetical protein